MYESGIMSKAIEPEDLLPWEQLDDQRQITLRYEFGYYLDTLPPTCSLESKIERFRQWLQVRGIAYPG